jgi:YebC/PmpR family DNA-binding regulatory protein
MSGHSKWKQIKLQKGATDQKRAAVFTKLGNAVTVAARQGGGNPDFNFTLRIAIDKAKLSNMPKDNIDRAIKRGTGEGGGQTIEEIYYEGFGPGKVAIIIQALTDNKNRTVNSLKHIFGEYHGSLGSPNSVMWMFEKRGVIRISTLKFLKEDRERIELLAIENGALDISDDDEHMVILTEPTSLQRVKEALDAGRAAVEYAELEFVPKEKKGVKEDDVRTSLEAFLDEIDEMEEVNNYFINAA